MKTEKHILYQTFPRLFGNYAENPVKNGSIIENGCGKFNSYTFQALNGIKELGVTHIWYTGIIAHSTCTDYTAYGIPKDNHAIVKGKACSPYAIKDYYDVDPDLAENVPNRMNEFRELVRRTHNAGMKVIIDFVPNHVSRSYRSLMKPAYIDDLGQYDRTESAFSPSNNFYYFPGQNLILHFGAQEEDFEYSEFPAKVTGNDCFNTNPGMNDWYETIKLNYGVDYLNGGSTHFSPVPDTWKKMLHILLYWSDQEIDGFRCDMAEMVPVEFWNWVIPQVKCHKNVLFFAEIYNPSRYREFIETGHFDYLYDKVGTYDLLRDIIVRKAPVFNLIQHVHANEHIKDRLLFFLENHDEQRIASDFFAGDGSPGLPALVFITTFGVNPVMIYNGQEVGEKGMDEEGFSGRDGKTTIFDYWRMDSIRRWANNGLFDGCLLNKEQRELHAAYQKILRLSREKAISMGNLFGLAYCNYNNPCFPSEKMLAYLRKYENELMLICINFDTQPYHFRLRIPQKAFDMMQIPDNTVSMMRDVLTEEEKKCPCALTYTCPFEGFIPAQSFKVLKFNF